jgi:hypothetical protein
MLDEQGWNKSRKFPFLLWLGRRLSALNNAVDIPLYILC